MYLGCSRDTYNPLDLLLYISGLIGDNCFIRLRGWSFTPWALLLVLERLIPLSNKHSAYELDVGCPLASLRILHKVVALIRWVVSQSKFFLLRCLICCSLVLILAKIIMLLPCWMKTEKLYLKLSLFLIRRMAATLYFPSFSPILLIPPILILAWKLLVTTGFLFIPSSLRKDSFFMSCMNPIQTDGWRKGTEIRKRKNDMIRFLLLTWFATDSL